MTRGLEFLEYLPSVGGAVAYNSNQTHLALGERMRSDWSRNVKRQFSFIPRYNTSIFFQCLIIFNPHLSFQVLANISIEIIFSIKQFLHALIQTWTFRPELRLASIYGRRALLVIVWDSKNRPDFNYSFGEDPKLKTAKPIGKTEPSRPLQLVSNGTRSALQRPRLLFSRRYPVSFCQVVGQPGSPLLPVKEDSSERSVSSHR